MKKYLSIIFSLLLAIILVTASPRAKKNAKPSLRSAKTVKTEQRENQKQIAKTKQQIEENNRRTRRQLNELNALQGEILRQQGNINRIQLTVDSFNIAIRQVEDTIKNIESNIARLKNSYAHALRKQRASRQTLNTLEFIFSAQSFSQSLKRMGYLKQASRWQKSKVAQLRAQKQLLDLKCIGLTELHDALSARLSELGAAQKNLQEKEQSTTKVVNTLKAEGASLKTVLAERQKKAQALTRELDRIIAEEARRAEQERIALEKKRKAEEAARQAAEAKRKAEEEKRIAEAKKKEETKKPSSANSKTSDKPTSSANTSPQAASTSTTTASSAPSASSTTTPSASKNVDLTSQAKNTTDKLTGTFASNKGRLPFPVAGKYNIVGQFGRNQHSELSHIEIENSGIDIATPSGTTARAVYEGTVSSIFHLDGFQNIVIVRHGDYLTVYAGIDNLSVKKGQTVKAHQTIGRIYTDPNDDNRTVLHFEVRHEKQKLNPLDWLTH